MKRLFVIALMTVMCIAAGAQGKWTVSHREADPLINQEAKDIYIYESPGIGTVVVWDWKDANFRLITENGFFHQVRLANIGLCVPVTVGFYDNDGNMKSKFQLIMFEEDNHAGKFIATGGYYMLGRGNIRKAMKQMKSGDGYLRIVADLYNRSKFDIKITPFEKQ